MTSAGNHGGGLQLYQGFVKIKAAGENVLSGLQALFQILSSICFCWELILLCTMAFVLIHAHGEEQTGICKLMDPAIIWNMSSVVNPEAFSLSPCSSTKQLPMQLMDICIPHVHINAENHSPDLLGPLIPSRDSTKVVMKVLAFAGGLGLPGGIGLAGWMLYKRWRPFTEADINMGLMREPAVPRRNDPTFKIYPSID